MRGRATAVVLVLVLSGTVGCDMKKGVGKTRVQSGNGQSSQPEPSNKDRGEPEPRRRPEMRDCPPGKSLYRGEASFVGARKAKVTIYLGDAIRKGPFDVRRSTANEYCLERSQRVRIRVAIASADVTTDETIAECRLKIDGHTESHEIHERVCVIDTRR